MILTLTLNPCIDLNLEVEDFSFSQPLRALQERRRAGGKGINVAATLNLLGTDATAVVLVGGPSGQEFRLLAERDQRYRLEPAEMAANTRTNIVITSRHDGRHLKVNQQGGEVSPEELQRVCEMVRSLLRPGDFAVLAGSLPPGAPADTYATLIENLHASGCRVALDTDLAALQEGVKARPDLIKPNREELERLVGAQLASEPEIVAAARTLAESSCGVCLVSNGAHPAYLVSQQHSFRGVPPTAHGSPVGAGDACLAGLVKTLSATTGGEYTEETLREGFRLAIACGSAAAAMPDTEYFTPDVLARTLKNVRIERIDS